MGMDSPPIVLLHGWGGSFASTFVAHRWVDDLAAAGRIVEPFDLPGHGRPASHAPSSYANLAALLESALPSGPIDLVGYSLGGKLALALATRDTSRYRRIVVGGVGDNLFAPEPNGEEVARALTDGVTGATPPAIAALVRYSSLSGSDPRALAAVLRRPPNPQLDEADLRSITADMLLVNGDADRIAGSDQRLRTALPTLRYRSLPGVDHLSLPARSEFRAAVIAFVGANQP